MFVSNLIIFIPFGLTAFRGHCVCACACVCVLSMTHREHDWTGLKLDPATLSVKFLFRSRTLQPHQFYAGHKYPQRPFAKIHGSIAFSLISIKTAIDWKREKIFNNFNKMHLNNVVDGCSRNDELLLVLVRHTTQTHTHTLTHDGLFSCVSDAMNNVYSIFVFNKIESTFVCSRMANNSNGKIRRRRRKRRRNEWDNGAAHRDPHSRSRSLHLRKSFEWTHLFSVICSMNLLKTMSMDFQKI